MQLIPKFIQERNSKFTCSLQNLISDFNVSHFQTRKHRGRCDKTGPCKRELRIKESKELNSTRDHSCLVTVGPNGKQMLDSHANRTQSLFILTHQERSLGEIRTNGDLFCSLAFDQSFTRRNIVELSITDSIYFTAFNSLK